MDNDSGTINLSTLMSATAMAVLLLVAGAAIPAAFATHQPANKAAVAGGSIEILGTELTEGSSSEVVTLLTSSLKATEQTDAVLSVTLECALWTDLVVVGNDNPSTSIASVKVWIEVDGEPLAVSGDDTEEPGQVVFCNRAYSMALMNFDDEEDDHQVETYLRTRSANAFNWFALNIGSGTHEITVKAQLDAEVSGQGTAQAGIGKRTLTVEPIKLANDVEI